jgi:hypothetical protein
MNIGEKFRYYSAGTYRNALFLSEENDMVKAVICDDRNAEGVNVEIHKSQIVHENQLNLGL